MVIANCLVIYIDNRMYKMKIDYHLLTVVMSLLQQRYHLVTGHDFVTTEVPFGDKSWPCYSRGTIW
jgi:hypothetical protein